MPDIGLSAVTKSCEFIDSFGKCLLSTYYGLSTEDTKVKHTVCWLEHLVPSLLPRALWLAGSPCPVGLECCLLPDTFPITLTLSSSSHRTYPTEMGGSVFLFCFVLPNSIAIFYNCGKIYVYNIKFTILKCTVQWRWVHSHCYTTSLQNLFHLPKLKLYPHWTLTSHSPATSPGSRHSPFCLCVSECSRKHSPFVAGSFPSASCLPAPSMP